MMWCLQEHVIMIVASRQCNNEHNENDKPDKHVNKFAQQQWQNGNLIYTRI